jgi:hypothetical protein
MKNSEFKIKIDKISKLIAEAEDAMSPDAQKFMDKIEGLRSSLDSVIKAISNVDELKQVIEYLVSNMPQITPDEVKMAMQKVAQSMGSASASKEPPSTTTMNESVQRWKQLAGLLTENNIQELSPATRNAAAQMTVDKTYYSDPLVSNKARRQYSTFSEIPQNLKKEADRIGNMAAKNLNTKQVNTTVIKDIPTSFSKTVKNPNTTLTMDFPDLKRFFKIYITPTRYSFDKSNIEITDPTISSILLRLIKNLQKDLEVKS